MKDIPKKKVNKIYDGYDFTGDGYFQQPRIKGRMKKKRRRNQRAIDKNILKKEVRRDTND